MQAHTRLKLFVAKLPTMCLIRNEYLYTVNRIIAHY